jgi:hypothetical protein
VKKLHQRNEPFWAELLPPLRLRLQAAMGICAQQGVLVVITRGFATREEQTILHDRHLRGGPLAAPPGRSWHEYGCAADCLPFRDSDHDLILDQEELTWDIEDEVWRIFVDAALAVGLNSGKSYGDGPHVDYHPGLSIAQAVALRPPDFFDLGIWGRLFEGGS